ncbi:MAG: V-type ATP synthase subunit D [Candidatus Cloacimonetes bacterium]|nr:V-type ATP synthase subunit D [Candidatus Cloacimonadota bacterium]
MAIKFQYNKSAMLDITKQMNIRLRALPTLKNKESALRLEVKKARDYTHSLDQKIQEKSAELDKLNRLWAEFNPELLTISRVNMTPKNIAGVKIPILGEVEYQMKKFNLFKAPLWYLDGIEILKQMSQLQIERQFAFRKMRILDAVRKKTTQKVNLYEKVQIPEFEDAIRKIKRFLEDEENLSKAGQKILKKRMESEVAL